MNDYIKTLDTPKNVPPLHQFRLPRPEFTPDGFTSLGETEHDTSSASAEDVEPVQRVHSLPPAESKDERPPLAQAQTERPPAKSRPSGYHARSADAPVTYQFDEASDSGLESSENEWEDRRDGQKGATATGAQRPKTPEELPSTDKFPRRSTSETEPYSRFSVGNAYFKTKGRVSGKDGRLKISVKELAHKGYLARALGAGIRHHFVPGAPGGLVEKKNEDAEEPRIESQIDGTQQEAKGPYPKLNIVVIIIGSRGDIQPFIKIAKILRDDYGHRVRIATHPAFRDFVSEENGLEHFSVGGDPSELMAFMVKNPGLIPSRETIKEGEIGRRRTAMSEMFEGMWRACIHATDDQSDEKNLKMMGEKPPFVADAIIANPPSFAHIHLAERLGVPLHMMFTFPYTPTTKFPHPLANIQSSDVDESYTNFLSYPLVEMMTWQGLGDLVNKFRVRTLGLEPVSTLWAPGQLFRLQVPYTYLWSPGLVPKPSDWGPEIDISGYVFVDMASSFEPPDALSKFLDAGEPPVYIGFGSIVVDDPNEFTNTIFEAVKLAGVRALVSKGWGGIGGDDMDVPDNILLLDNTPHDWLFPRVRAVVHHGGAGSTAIGLKCGKPTMIVPFFGDQPFWGAMVASAGAGAKSPVKYKKLSAERLAEGIKECLTDEAQEAANKIAESINKEGDGAANAVASFHRNLPLRSSHRDLPLRGEYSMRCSIFEDRVAVWEVKKTQLRLSALAADILAAKKKIKWKDLRLIRHNDWNDFGGAGGPITGVGGAAIDTVTDVAKGTFLTPVKAWRVIKKHEKHSSKKKRREKQAKKKREGNVRVNNENDGNDENGESIPGKPISPTSQDGRPKSRKRGGTNGSNLSVLSEDPPRLSKELGDTAAWGFKTTASAISKAPMELSLALAQGFHNAPRLYGDETVRRPPRVSGWKSGVRAGGHEFAYGIYDGVTGLVTLPAKGTKDGGVIGGLTGFGMGLGGLVLKTLGAGFAPLPYTMKGIHKEVVKGKQPIGFIRKARIIQGQNEARALSPQEKAEKEKAVNDGWDVVQTLIHGRQSIRDENFLGRLKARRMEHEWKKAGALDSVKSRQKALADVGKKENASPTRPRGSTVGERPKSAEIDKGALERLPTAPGALSPTGAHNETEGRRPGSARTGEEDTAHSVDGRSETNDQVGENTDVVDHGIKKSNTTPMNGVAG